MQDSKASFACTETLAESGNALAQLALGGFYAGGYGVPQDPQQAAVWYQKAAGQGNAAAMSKLGDAYLTGTGVPQDDGKAAAWFGKAANQGDAWSMEKLGSLYEAGQGVGQDYTKAYQWYDVAAARGDPHAAALRDNLAQKMTAEQIAAAKNGASEWIAQSAMQAATAHDAALSTAVDACVAVVRGTNTSPFYANFQAAYQIASGTIEYRDGDAQGPLAAFQQCMAAKGYGVAATRAR
ncbi:MAG TPA: tetratricopeptide repeat protein [Stellaceae bacterium]|nr:tetratricopeptide repeat protein [Stellaceae bacterium]